MSQLANASRLIVRLDEIPEEGRRFQGEIPAEVFALEDDFAVPGSPIRYDLLVTEAGDELLVTGELSAEFRLRCVRTLVCFPHKVELRGYAESFEIGNRPTLDLTERLREDILLALPAYPRLEEPEGAAERQEATPVEPEGEPSLDHQQRNHVWDVLDSWDKEKES